MKIDELRSRYIAWFGPEPTEAGELERVAELLGVDFPQDFREISSFYSGGIIGGISHNAIAAGGPATNIADETMRLRAAIALPHSLIVLSEPPASLIVMNTNPNLGSSAVIWCDSTDVSRLDTPDRLRNAQIWPNYADFFQFLIDAESQERAGLPKH